MRSKFNFILILCTFVPLWLTASDTNAQLFKRTFKLTGVDSTLPQPSSNYVGQIFLSKGRVFFATDNGINITTDGGNSFETNFGKNGPTGIGVDAIAAIGDTIVVTVSSDTSVGVSGLVGKGLFVSTDNGATWTREPQSVDTEADTLVTFGSNTLKALPITTGIDNVSYSVALHKGYIYTANFAGGVRRSADLGKTWERVVLPPDFLSYITKDSSNYSFQLSPIAGNLTDETNYNHEGFSLLSDGDSVLYVGTADGIDKTTDNGYSWQKFDHQNTNGGISGNWVVSMSLQNSGATHVIWGGTVLANGSTEKSGLSYTADGGSTWKNIFDGHRFDGIAFHDSTVVYGASVDGLFRTQDLGRSSQVITNIYDPNSKQSILTQSFYDAAANGDSIWVASGDGTAMGIDNGTGFDLSRWHVFKAYVNPIASAKSTYFYPNPFSPHLNIGRIHYAVKNAGSQVTIRIYDFSMHIVRTLLQNATRGPVSSGGYSEEPWNGASDRGGFVDNGVYFYSVAVNGGTPSWGKIMVIR